MDVDIAFSFWPILFVPRFISAHCNIASETLAPPFDFVGSVHCGCL